MEFNNVNEFIELLIQLEEDELNDYLEKLGDKFIIGNTEFYSEKEEISIRLFNLIIQKLKPKLKEDNKYLVDNKEPLKQIYNDIIEEKNIRYDNLEKFSKADKALILEKIRVLTYVSNRDISPEEEYIYIMKCYNEMKVELENLDNYEKTLAKYHSESKKKEINEIHNKKEEIKTITYKTFYSKEKMIINQLLENCRIIFEKVNTIKSLNIFQIIYHMIINTKKNIKISINKEDKDDFDSAFEDFKELKKYLEEKGIENIESTKHGYILRSIYNKR